MFDKLKECSFVCVDKLKALEAGKKFNPNIHHVCEGYDSLRDKPHKVAQHINVSFIGNPDGNRMKLCKSVAAVIYADAYGDAHAVRVSWSKINLNFCRNGCASDRVYKIMAAGGFLLTDDWDGRKKMFEDGKDLIIFKTEKDLKDAVDHFLIHPDARDEIRNNGYHAVEKYSRDNWARKIVELANV
jgi:hypothetical protein